MKYKKIALIGMMGSGKSSVAECLSRKTGLELFELDRIFETKKNISIKDFFKNFGEEKFRESETQILKQTLNYDSFIVSTGGGVVLKSENRNLLFNKDICSIYLKTSADTIYERIKNDSKRPLLLVSNPKEEIEKILSKRECFYNLAEFIIDTDNKTIDEISEEILKWIK